MTLQEFIGANPTNWGTGNANLLISSSVSGSYPYTNPIAPYTVKGITMPVISKNNKKIEPALKEVTEFRFNFNGQIIKSSILGRQKRRGYYFFQLTDFIINELPETLDFDGNVIYDDSEFVFVPYVAVSFINNDYNVLLSNSARSKLNTVRQVADRNTNAAIPSNLVAILSQSAEPAELQNCSYTKIGLISSRYQGTKTTKAGPVFDFNYDNFESKVNTNAIPGNDPALALKEFKGSLHPNDSSNETIKEIQLSDREIINIFFNTELSGSHPNKSYSSFPQLGSFLEQEQGTRFVRAVNSKVYSVDKGTIITTDEIGQVTSIQ